MNDIKKINESDLSLQDKVRKDHTACDHIGFYTPLGFESYPEDIAAGKFKIITGVLCMMCGQVFQSIHEIASISQSN